ncbi:MAG: hypothetical protein ABII85_02240 [Bacillota bacterium]
MKERLKELGIRLTELADYFNLSRPTIYKYIELYEKGKMDQINPLIRNVFVFISNKEVLSKKEVITYIINILDKELVFTDHDAILRMVYDKMKTSTSIDTLNFIMNWLDHPEYSKFMESFNKYEKMIKSKQKINIDDIDTNYSSYAAIVALNDPEKKTKQRKDKIIKYIEERRKEND